MIKINLIPSEIIEKVQQRQRTIQIAFASTILVLMLIGVSAARWMTVQGLEKDLAFNEQELKRLASLVAMVEDLKRRKASLESRLGVVTGLLRGRPAYPYFMSDFTKTVPGGVRVKTLSTIGGGNSPISLSLQADAAKPEDIQSWIKKLIDTGQFSNVTMGDVTTKKEDGRFIRSFSLTTVYKPNL